MILVGVDGCPGGWVAAVSEACGHDVKLIAAPRLVDLFREISGPKILAIDMPIGLPDAGRRLCDEHARELLGPRRSTIFYAPPSCVLKAESHAEACELAEAATGKRISIQAWNLVPKIREVAKLKQKLSAESQLVETHPEVCFARMAGGVVEEPKKTAKGRRQRGQLISQRFQLEDPANLEVRVIPGVPRPPLEDRLDALACLSTALYASCQHERTLPRQAETTQPCITY